MIQRMQNGFRIFMTRENSTYQTLAVFFIPIMISPVFFAFQITGEQLLNALVFSWAAAVAYLTALTFFHIHRLGAPEIA